MVDFMWCEFCLNKLKGFGNCMTKELHGWGCLMLSQPKSPSHLLLCRNHFRQQPAPQDSLGVGGSFGEPRWGTISVALSCPPISVSPCLTHPVHTKAEVRQDSQGLESRVCWQVTQEDGFSKYLPLRGYDFPFGGASRKLMTDRTTRACCWAPSPGSMRRQLRNCWVAPDGCDPLTRVAWQVFQEMLQEAPAGPTWPQVRKGSFQPSWRGGREIETKNSQRIPSKVPKQILVHTHSQ